MEIIILCGKICSGKDWVAQNRFSDFKQIATHDAVVDIIKSEKRSEMQDTIDLDSKIASWLINRINFLVFGGHEKFIITGIRQVSIIETLLKPFPDATLKWVEADTDVRKKRYESNRGRNEDISFEKADEQDIILGISDVKSFIFDFHNKSKKLHCDYIVNDYLPPELAHNKNYFIVMGGTNCGKNTFLKHVCDHIIKNGMKFHEISIIDFAKEIKKEYIPCGQDFDPDSREPKARKLLASIKDAFDEYGKHVCDSCNILMNKIFLYNKKYGEPDYTFITIREPKDANVIKEHYNCEVIYIKRKVEHENKIRCEILSDQDLLNIADHVIENDGDLDNFFDEIEKFITYNL